MALKPSTKLGPYEILSQLDAGGMGEVYKARDTRLNRTVALKTLLAHLADKPELRERFQREAETIASLQHPHICVLFDIRKDNDVDYLVMEYLEGETLAQRLKKGPLPLDQVLQFATEIADALDKAHRKGVTHRDIKPGNVMLVKEGSGYSTKLLDFGLAKLKQEAAKEFVLDSQAPTPPLADHLTQQGEILGTLQYMAPEQVEGKNDEIDARTDIFSFGVLVYEMATGKKAFEGKTRPSMMASILKENPPSMTTIQPMTPVALDRVVKKCLAKDPDERWQTARDISDELKWMAEPDSQGGVPASAAGSKDGRRALPWAAALLVGAILSGLAVWKLRPTPEPPAKPINRFNMKLSSAESLSSSALYDPTLALSPDGSQLVFVADNGGAQQLFLRSMDSFDAKPIPGTAGAVSPFFSPDGQWIGFAVANKLMKVSVSGGPALALCNYSGTIAGASWGPNDAIVFALGNSGLYQVSSNGGTAQVLAAPDSNSGQMLWPEFLPGGKAILFSAWRTTGDVNGAQIVVQRLDTGERKVLIQGSAYAKYAPSGHLIYYRAGTLMAVPFDLNKLEIKGSPTPIVEGVLTGALGLGAAQFSFSKTGSLVYVPGSAEGMENALFWVDRKGEVQPLGVPPHSYTQPRFSPDGRKLAITIQESSSDVWIYDLSRSTLTRFTFEGTNLSPIWSPDGKRLTFISTKAGPLNLFSKFADGTGGEEQITKVEHLFRVSSISPDGKTAFYVDTDPKTGKDLWTVSLEGDHKTTVFLQTPFDESVPKISPDGHWLAHTSNESGRDEVYVRPYPGPGGKWQISTAGGQAPVWRRDGKELFFINGGKMMAVDIATQPSFTAGTPHMLFQGPYERRGGGSGSNFDISPDGQRFLMVRSLQQQSSLGQINVVLNWFEELKQRVPVK